MPDDRMITRARSGGKSGLQKTECRITSGGGNPRESATENKPPFACKR